MLINNRLVTETSGLPVLDSTLENLTSNGLREILRLDTSIAVLNINRSGVVGSENLVIDYKSGNHDFDTELENRADCLLKFPPFEQMEGLEGYLGDLQRLKEAFLYGTENLRSGEVITFYLQRTGNVYYYVTLILNKTELGFVLMDQWDEPSNGYIHRVTKQILPAQNFSVRDRDTGKYVYLPQAIQRVADI